MSTQREEAVISIGVDHSKVDAGLKTVGRKIEQFSHGVKEIFVGIAAGFTAAFTAEGLISGFENLTRYVKDITRISEGTGLSTGLVQDLMNIAKASGVASESIESMLDRFAKNLAPGSDPEEALAAIADQLNDMADPGEKARFAIEEFGKAGVKLIPILSQGSAGLRDMAAGFGQISKDEIEAIDAMDRRFERWGTKTKAFFADQIASAILLASMLKESIIKHPFDFNYSIQNQTKRRAKADAEKEIEERNQKRAVQKAAADEAKHLETLKTAAEKQDFLAKIALHKAVEDDRAKEALEKKREAALEKHLKNLRTIWFSNQIGGAAGDPKKQVAHNHDAELNAILGEEAARDMNLRSGNTIFAARRQRDIDAAKSRLAGTLSKEFQVQNAKSPRDQLIDDLMKRIGATVGKKGAIVVEVMDDDQ